MSAAPTPRAPGRRRYAGAVSRAAGYVVDATVVNAVALGTLVVVRLIGMVVGRQARDLAEALVPVFVFVLPAVLALYCMVFWALAGRTPGMALLGLRVVSTAGRPIAWFSALVRALVLAYFPIGAVWCLIDPRRQAIHDKLARTVVVRVVTEGLTPDG